MNPVPAQREYFLDSIRAWLMLLGIPFHISLIYSSHTWHVNSAEPSLWLTLLMTSSTRSACRYFSLYPGTFPTCFFTLSLEKMVESTCRTCRYPDVNSHPLLTLPQFIMLQYVKGKRKVGLDCHCMTNIIRWPGINITPVVFTGVSGHDDAVRLDIQTYQK